MDELDTLTTEQRQFIISIMRVRSPIDEPSAAYSHLLDNIQRRFRQYDKEQTAKPRNAWRRKLRELILDHDLEREDLEDVYEQTTTIR